MCQETFLRGIDLTPAPLLTDKLGLWPRQFRDADGNVPEGQMVCIR